MQHKVNSHNIHGVRHSPLPLLDHAGTEDFLIQGGVQLLQRGLGLRGYHDFTQPLTPARVHNTQTVMHAGVDLRLRARAAATSELHRWSEVGSSGEAAVMRLELPTLVDPSAISMDAMDSRRIDYGCGRAHSSCTRM
jgi:hypothetical protein